MKLIFYIPRFFLYSGNIYNCDFLLLLDLEHNEAQKNLTLYLYKWSEIIYPIVMIITIFILYYYHSTYEHSLGHYKK